MRWLALLLAAGGCTRSGPPSICPSPLHPSARSDTQPILVADTNQIYVYGGNGGGSELWRRSFGSCGGWQQLTPAQTPEPFLFYAAAFDDSRHRIVYIGYRQGGGTSEAWALDTDHLAFTKLVTVGTAPTDAATAVYDRMHDRVIAVGALTYALDFSGSSQGAWSTLGASSGSSRAAAGFDPVRQLLLLYDGTDVYAFALFTSRWQTVSLPPTGNPRGETRLTWDAVGQRTLAVADATYALALDGNATLGSFAQLSPEAPPARAGAAVVADGDSVWLFGGRSGACLFDDEWQFGLVDKRWTTLHPATACP